MNRNNLNNIRAMFENKTGVTLPKKSTVSPVVVTAGIVAAAAAACVTITAVVVNEATMGKRKKLSV